MRSWMIFSLALLALASSGCAVARPHWEVKVVASYESTLDKATETRYRTAIELHRPVKTK